MYVVFLSYAQNQASNPKLAKKILDSEKVPTWMDVEGLRTGDQLLTGPKAPTLATTVPSSISMSEKREVPGEAEGALEGTIRWRARHGWRRTGNPVDQESPDHA